MSITQEVNGLLNNSGKRIQPPATAERRANRLNGLVMGSFFTIILMVGTQNIWLSVNFGLGMFLLIGDILRFDDGGLGVTAGFLAAICASAVLGSVFGPEIGKVTALGLLITVAPSVHMMDTEPGWGRGGRNFMAVCWAMAMSALFLAWFFENYTLRFVN